MQKQVSMEQALSAGWQAFVGNLGLIGVMLVWGLLVQGPNMGLRIGEVLLMKDNKGDGAMVMGLIFMGLGLGVWAWGVFMGPFLHAGWIKIILKALRGEQWQFGELFSCLPLWWNMFASSFLYGLMVGFGSLMLIAPGVFLGISFGFYRFFVVEEGMGPIKALEASWELTSGCRMQLFLLGLVCFFIGIGGVICLIIGIIPAMAVTELAWADAYRQMRGATAAASAGDGPAYGGPYGR